MKKINIVFVILIGLVLSCCLPLGQDETFTLLGQWGMVSGTINDADGTTNRYPSLGEGSYYQYLEFYADGSLKKTTEPDRTVTYGVYVYNESSGELSYKFDGNKYYYPGSIYILSPREMNLTTDYGSSIGVITQYFVKLK